jgi:hypothetical protein
MFQRKTSLLAGGIGQSNHQMRMIFDVKEKLALSNLLALRDYQGWPVNLSSKPLLPAKGARRRWQRADHHSGAG